MSEMVDRVARVIWDAKLKPGGGGRTMMPWPLCPEATWCREVARLVIEAMREPTGMMFMKGGNVPPSNQGRDHLPMWQRSSKRIGDLAAKDVWQTMIDAALNEYEMVA